MPASFASVLRLGRLWLAASRCDLLPAPALVHRAAALRAGLGLLLHPYRSPVRVVPQAFYGLLWRTCQQTPARSMMWSSRPHGNSVGSRNFTPGKALSRFFTGSSAQ